MKPIRISLDVTKLDKSKFIKGEKGTYAKLSIVETDSEHSTHIVFQDLGKDDKGEYIKGEIIGSAKRWKEDNQDIKVDDDGLPF